MRRSNDSQLLRCVSPFLAVTRAPMREKNPRSGMRRREFIARWSSAAVTGASAPRAQPPPVPVIGLLGSDAAPAQSEWTAAFLQRLRELRGSDGRAIMLH